MRQKSRRFFDRTKKNLNIFDFAIVAPFFLMWQANAGGFGLVAFDGSFSPLAWLPCPFTKILDAFAPAQRRATIFPPQAAHETFWLSLPRPENRAISTGKWPKVTCSFPSRQAHRMCHRLLRKAGAREFLRDNLLPGD
jgi:hypothetical protein